MSIFKRPQAAAFGFATEIMERYANFGGTDDHECSDVIAGRIVDELQLHHPSYARYSGWTFIYNASQVPACCGGECEEHQVITVGHVEIISSSGQVFTFTVSDLIRMNCMLDESGFRLENGRIRWNELD